jgi:hypothetical protein
VRQTVLIYRKTRMQDLIATTHLTLKRVRKDGLKRRAAA